MHDLVGAGVFNGRYVFYRELDVFENVTPSWFQALDRVQHNVVECLSARPGQRQSRWQQDASDAATAAVAARGKNTRARRGTHCCTVERRREFSPAARGERTR